MQTSIDLPAAVLGGAEGAVHSPSERGSSAGLVAALLTSRVAAVLIVEGDGGKAFPARPFPSGKRRGIPRCGVRARLLFRRRKVGGGGGRTKKKTNPSLRGRLFHISRAAIDLAPQKHRQCRPNQICQSCVFQETSGTVNDYTARHGERERLGVIWRWSAVLARLAARAAPAAFPVKPGPRAAAEQHLPRRGMGIPAPLSPSDSFRAAVPPFSCGRGREGWHTVWKMEFFLGGGGEERAFGARGCCRSGLTLLVAVVMLHMDVGGVCAQTALQTSSN